MKEKVFLGLASILALPVMYFFLDSIMLWSIFLILMVGMVYVTRVKKVKFDIALTVALALMFGVFLLGNIGISNHNSVFINTNTLDMGITQVLFLKPTLWLAALGLYSLCVHTIYNYQKRIKPNMLLVAVPFIILVLFILKSFFSSTDFIRDYLRSI